MKPNLDVDAFWDNCIPEPNSGCWIWMGGGTEHGHYGTFYANGRGWPAHRIAWEIANGRKMPSNRLACHKCDFKPCVNPDHIYAGTSSDNNKDTWRARTRLAAIGLSIPKTGKAAGNQAPCDAPGCKGSVIARGLCMRCYKAAGRSGTLPPREEREPTRQVALRIPAETWAALERAAQASGETEYAVALGVLERWATGRAKRG